MMICAAFGIAHCTMYYKVWTLYYMAGNMRNTFNQNRKQKEHDSIITLSAASEIATSQPEPLYFIDSNRGVLSEV